MPAFVKIIGVVIILLSFLFILKRPDKSMLDTMMDKRKKDMEKLMEEQNKESEEDSEKE